MAEVEDDIVFVLFWREYDGSDFQIEGVYRDPELAQHIMEVAKRHTHGDWEIARRDLTSVVVKNVINR